MKTKHVHHIPLLLLYQWRRVIITVTAVAVLLSTIITMPIFIAPIFKAESIIYPPAVNSAKIIAEYDLRFGADKEIDEHIQILKSSMLRDSITRRFDLMKHYEIEADEENKLDKLNKLYEENIVVERTRYNSIAVKVFDEDPMLAAEICNTLIKTGDKVKAFILKQNLNEAINAMQQKLISTNKELEILGIEIRKMNSNIVLSYNTLIKQKYAERIKVQIELQNYIASLKDEKNTALIEMLFSYEDKLSRFYLLKDSYEQAIQSLNTKIADAYVITPAQIPDKKYAPKRMVIVFSTMLISVIICCFLILAIDKLKQMKEAYADLVK